MSIRQHTALNWSLKPQADRTSPQEYTAILPNDLTFERTRQAARYAASKSLPAALASLLSIC